VTTWSYIPEGCHLQKKKLFRIFFHVSEGSDKDEHKKLQQFLLSILHNPKGHFHEIPMITETELDL
jgi:hypothetical protein